MRYILKLFMLIRIIGFKSCSELLFFLLLGVLFIATGAVAGDKTTSGRASGNIIVTRSNQYIIGSGDLLDIITWKEPDFSREEVLVRNDGKISFPLLNDIQAAGKSPMALKKDIEIGLKNFVDNPVVTVTIREPVSQKFYVLGQVMRTGEYQLVKDLTVLQAFALAGGFTEWAEKNEIILLRRESGKDKIIRIKYYNIIKGKDLSQNIMIRADDTIIVP